MFDAPLQLPIDCEETASFTEDRLIRACLDHFTETHRPTADMISTFMDVVVCADILNDLAKTEELLRAATRWIIERRPSDIDIMTEHHSLLLGFFALLSMTFPQAEGIDQLFAEAIDAGGILTQHQLPSSGYNRKLDSELKVFWKRFNEMTHPEHLRYSEPSRTKLLTILQWIRDERELVRARYQKFFDRTFIAEDKSF